MRSIILALLAMLFLAACEHTPPLTSQERLCNFVRYSLETPLPGEKPIQSILTDNPGDMLLLSGGSENGAFGAGFLAGWHSTGTMPRFGLVTGISTGALQATGTFIGRHDITVRGYTIEDESDLLDVFVSANAVEGGLGFFAIKTLLKRGAISDLTALEKRLHGLYTPDVIEAVGARYEGGKGARLLVGVTDIDLGRAVALDLTQLANRYKQTSDKNERKLLKNCYIKALLASSIVPPAARPIFIDNRMYIDGGLRYALFDDRLGEVLANKSFRESRPRMFAILNATGTSRARCGKVDDADCDPITSTTGQREDWDVLGLAMRSLELFETQIKRLSVDRAQQRAKGDGEEEAMPFFFARILPDDMTRASMRFAIPDFEGVKTCASWRKDDRTRDETKPLQFHRRYMRCLIQYGCKRGREGRWDHPKLASDDAIRPGYVTNTPAAKTQDACLQLIRRLSVG